MAQLTEEQFNVLKISAFGGNDDDLLPEDRRDRSNIVDGANLVVGQEVNIEFIGPTKVLGPGRGKNYFLAGYFDEDVGLCVGSFRIEQIV